MEGYKAAALVLLAALAAADGGIWFRVASGAPDAQASISFLDVGQGDGILLNLPGGVRMLTDAGPDAKVVASFERALPSASHSIDLAIVTHPELDHFNGFNSLLAAGYRIGAFVVNGRGRGPESKQWAELMQRIRDAHIPLIAVAEGDRIRYGGTGIAILAPGPQFIASSELNDTGIVQKVVTPGFTALLTADTGINVEEYLRTKYDLAADILKIGHHGSKYSTGAALLRATHPVMAAVSDGARNTYGHPAKETLERLGAAGIPVFRTDQKGTIAVRQVNGKLRVATEK